MWVHSLKTSFYAIQTWGNQEVEVCNYFKHFSRIQIWLKAAQTKETAHFSSWVQNLVLRLEWGMNRNFSVSLFPAACWLQKEHLELCISWTQNHHQYEQTHREHISSSVLVSKFFYPDVTVQQYDFISVRNAAHIHGLVTHCVPIIYRCLAASEKCSLNIMQ